MSFGGMIYLRSLHIFCFSILLLFTCVVYSDDDGSSEGILNTKCQCFNIFVNSDGLDFNIFYVCITTVDCRFSFFKLFTGRYAKFSYV